MKKLISLLTVALLISCGGQTEKDSADTTNATYDLAVAPDSWIEERVANAQERLSASPAGQKIWASIEAHGGLNKWFANGPVSFHFDYQPLDGSTRRDSYQIVDQWSVRTVHEVAANRVMKYGWDGKNAWSFPDTANVGVNPRFWSNTPFYFIALPFVLADEGVNLEELDPKEYKGVTYDLVKATYKDGTGDAPDDFYVIYIHPETKQMGGLRYIVSYPGFFPNGGNGPEKFMEILGVQTSDGVTIPTGYNTYLFKENEVAEHITKIDVTDFNFMPNLKKDFFDAPEGAKIKEGL
ncbi:MAG: hypothetical protein ABJG78_01495 [Cyclobacteriaceae bacterium]